MHKIKAVVYYFLALYLIAVGVYYYATQQNPGALFILFIGGSFLGRSQKHAFIKKQRAQDIQENNEKTKNRK